jgi:hypothetical protein
MVEAAGASLLYPAALFAALQSNRERFRQAGQHRGQWRAFSANDEILIIYREPLRACYDSDQSRGKPRVLSPLHFVERAGDRDAATTFLW